jgi:glycine dehydrogenase
LKGQSFCRQKLFPQTRCVAYGAVPVQIELVEGDYQTATIDSTYFGAIVQYPNDKGSIQDYRALLIKYMRVVVVIPTCWH